jgi:hypothetical protein
VPGGVQRPVSGLNQAATKKTAPAREAAQFNLSTAGLLAVAVDDDGLAVVIEITIAVTLPDHDGVVTIPVVAFPDDFTIAITPAIGMTRSNGHTDRANTNANFFRTSRHRKGYSSHRYRGHYKTLDHFVLLSLSIIGKEFAGM